MMEALRSSEMPILSRPTCYNIPEDSIPLDSHLVLCQKLTNEQLVSRCVVVQPPGPPFPSASFNICRISVKVFANWQHVALQDPSCFNLQNSQKAQKVGSPYRMYSITNLCGMIRQV
jgi:hypothetical protein